MKLSDIVTTPLYNCILPSTGKTVHFRPIVVKEERALLTAFESENASVMLATLVQVVKNAVQGDVKLTPYDVEYLFLKIRTKSVGEISDLLYTCSECGEKTEIQVNIENVEVLGQPGPATIKVSDELAFIMKEPSIDDVLGIDPNNPDAAIRSTVVSCIDKIAYKDEVLSVAEEPIDEIVRLLDRLTSDQFSMLRKYIDTRPTIQLKHSWTCPHCNHTNDEVLQGIYDFF